MRTIITLLLILFITTGFAQDKVEIEKSIKKEEVPLSAVEDLAEILGSNHKVKWFYQEDGNKKVYEAKFEFNSKDYSVEFDTEGLIYNVEFEINVDDLNAKQSSKLEKKFSQLFENYKIRKIQIEHFGDTDGLFNVIRALEVDQALIIQYEIEVKAKSEKNRALFEFIFDDKMNLISKREIKLKSTDLLDY